MEELELENIDNKSLVEMLNMLQGIDDALKEEGEQDE